MADDGRGLLDRVLQQGTMRRWARASRSAWSTDLKSLRRQRHQAKLLRTQLDTLIHHAEERLALPRIGTDSFPMPSGADWGWRPDLWRGPLPGTGRASVQSKTRIGNELTVFHDCPLSELTLRQVRNQRSEDLAPYGLRLDVFRFEGSFLSVVLDLPDGAVRGLSKAHLIRLESIIELEAPLEIFARINIRHGPNTEQIVRELSLQGKDVMLEFDLAYSNLNTRRVERAWIDLIFEGPQMNQIVLRDLTFARRLRAAL